MPLPPAARQRQSPRRALPRGRRRPLSTVLGLSAAAVAVCLRGGPGGLGVGKARETQPWSWKGLREAICCSSVRGRGRPDAEGAAATAPECGPRPVPTGLPGVGRGTASAQRTGLPSWALPPSLVGLPPSLVGPPPRCHRRSGSRGPGEAGGRRPLPAPQSASSEPRGGTASPLGPGLHQRGAPRTCLPGGGCVPIEILFCFLFCVTNHAALWEL